MPSITVTELAALRDANLIDVREPDEYARGHVPGAVNIPVSRFPQELRRISAGRPVHVMCESGGRSSRVTAQLQQLGTDAVDVAGGTAAWRWAGHALDAA